MPIEWIVYPEIAVFTVIGFALGFFGLGWIHGYQRRK